MSGAPAGAATTPAAVAAAVAACPAVAGLHAGTVASYLPGERIAGVRIGEDRATISVDLAYPATVHDLETQVRAALARLVAVPVDIEVADVVVPGEEPVPGDGSTVQDIAPTVTGTPTRSDPTPTSASVGDTLPTAPGPAAGTPTAVRHVPAYANAPLPAPVTTGETA